MELLLADFFFLDEKNLPTIALIFPGNKIFTIELLCLGSKLSFVTSLNWFGYIKQRCSRIQDI